MSGVSNASTTNDSLHADEWAASPRRWMLYAAVGLVAGAVPAWVLPAGAESFSFGAWGDVFGDRVIASEIRERGAARQVYQEARDAGNTAAKNALADPAAQARIRAMGAEPAPLGPEAYGAFIRAELERWAPVVKASGAVVE